MGMQGGIKGEYDCIREFSEVDYTADLTKIDKPTLVIHGDDDQIVPIAASAEKTAKIVKARELKVYKGGEPRPRPGRGWHLQRGPACLRALLSAAAGPVFAAAGEHHPITSRGNQAYVRPRAVTSRLPRAKRITSRDHAPNASSGRETIAEHWKTAKGFRLGGLVLKNVPVLGELAIFEMHDVGSDP